MSPACPSCDGRGIIVNHLGVMTTSCWSCGGTGECFPYSAVKPPPLGLDPGPPDDLLRNVVSVYIGKGTP